ncbi:MAG: hypothetical protein RL318_2854 [Fibrobacterota bacterium]|jgi:chemotaxis protein methyltransferase CheR
MGDARLRGDLSAGRSISDAEFKLFQEFFHDLIGLHLADHKKALVSGRLGRRLTVLGLEDFHGYFRLISSKDEPEELQVAIDLITTNETSFFRERDHFELLAKVILPSFARKKSLQVWCGASSTGEEPYTLAMVMHRHWGASGWRLIATDINSEVLAKARQGLYPMERAAGIADQDLKAYCLRGTGEFEGKFLIDKPLRSRIEFRQMNLMQLDRDLQDLDIVFLRNVLIYFDAPTKERLLTEVGERMRSGAWLLLGHSESLTGLHLPQFHLSSSSVYRKP